MKDFCLFFFLFTTTWSQAQQLIIKDIETNTPILGVEAFNESKTKNDRSDFRGIVSLNKFNEDEIITFQHLSYKKQTIDKSKIGLVLFLEPKSYGLDEVVISASKFEQNKREVPQKIISIAANDISLANPQTSADVLGNSGHVFIQKSQLGGGSPMIRGFSTNRLLLSVDDVRMNNAIFRGGNVQNVISINPFTIENTEVILGSGSVIYGSDAIGGVMNFYTKKPKLTLNDSLLFNANMITRYASANSEKTAHLDVNFGYKQWSFLSSVSYTNFDDLKMGKHGPDDYLRLEYITSNNGNDQIITNTNPRTQRFTGYNQINLMQKIKHKLDDKTNFNLGLHYSTTSDYPRYDRLIQYNDNVLKYAQWDYGPQRWLLANLQMTRMSSNSSLHDKVKVTAAYQNFKESRINRNYNSEIRRHRVEQVNAFSFNVDFEKAITNNAKLSYGAEYLYNKVNSQGREINLDNNTAQNIATRYPDGSSWQSLAAYFSYKYKFDKKFTFQSGIRYNHISIQANLEANNTFYNFPFTNANLDTGAFTGTAGLTWSPNTILEWKFNLSSAFRAPNIDDIGKLFDSEPGSVIVPNNNLKPEYAYGGDLGLTLNFHDNISLELSTYYTYLDNALVRRDFNLNGETQIIYDGELSDVKAIQNASKSWIYGFEAGIKMALSKNLKFTSQYNFIGGTEEVEDGIEVPVRHVSPSFGNAHLIWHKNKLKCNAFMNFNGELSFNQLAPSELDKAYLYATDKNGNPYSPSWYTFNVRSQYQITKAIWLSVTVENITNQRYRTYSSGVAAAGQNLIIALKYSL